MDGQVHITIMMEDDSRRAITIDPIVMPMPGKGLVCIGAYEILDSGLVLGDMIFDESLDTWEFRSIGLLTYDELYQIAQFIRTYQEDAG